ncbi:MAG: hypothetical protein CMN30_25985 [Sandaracinus sp.]|nr:hypothetical protein [Sandaracinus sp.]
MFTTGDMLPSMRALVVLLAVSFAACGDDDGSAPLDAAMTPDAGSDGGTTVRPDLAMPMCPPGEPMPDAFDCTTDPGVPLGEPIEAEADTWTWVPFDDAHCMDGSSTGIGIRTAPESDRLLILLEGGGACFDVFSCVAVANPDGYGEAAFASDAARGLNRGITSRTDESNPFRDWNMVYVPYCSGDAHAGTAADGTGFDGRTQTGHTNYGQFVARIAATFPDVSQVVLAGRSAGGLGTLVNYPVTASAFGCTPVHVLDDSGPLLPDEYMRPCLVSMVNAEWSIAIPEGCDLCSCEGDAGLVNSIPFLARRYPDRRFGLASYTEDRTFRSFFGFGYSSGCDIPRSVPDGEYTAGLLELRELMGGDANFRTFLVEGDQHTFTFGSLGSASAGGLTLGEWTQQLIDGDAAWSDVGP